MDILLKRIEKAVSTLSYLVGSLVLLLLIGIIINYKDIDWLSKFGGFIGGILGTIIAGVVFIYVKKTYNLQEQELRSTKEYIKKQQFESTFFNMLSMINTIGLSMEHTVKHYPPSQPTSYERGGFYKYFIQRLKNETLNVGRDDSDVINNWLVKQIHMIDPSNKNFIYEELNGSAQTGVKNIY